MRPRIIVAASALGIISLMPALAMAAQPAPPPGWAAAEPDASPDAEPVRDRAVESRTQPPPASPPSAAASTGEAREPASTVAIVANPIALLFSMFNVDVGVAVADKTSANLGVNYWSFEIFGVKHTAWGFGLGAQHFFYRDRFAGAFVYPAIEYANSQVSIGNYEISGSLFGPSAIVGYQWNWHPFTIRVGGGGRYYFGNVESDGLKSDLAGFAFKADGSLGVAF